MSFKDLIKKDVQKIFMNPDEFSEIHNINDKEIGRASCRERV